MSRIRVQAEERLFAWIHDAAGGRDKLWSEGHRLAKKALEAAYNEGASDGMEIGGRAERRAGVEAGIRYAHHRGEKPPSDPCSSCADDVAVVLEAAR